MTQLFILGRSRTLLLLLALCFLVPASPARAQEGPQGGQPPGGPEMRPRQLLRQALRGGGGNEAIGQQLLRLLGQPEAQKVLGITEEQRKKLEDIGFNARKAAIQQRATLQVQRMELQRLLQADNPDRAAIDKKVAELSQAQTALMRTMVNGLVDARGALTKEQRDKIRDYMQRQVRQRAQPGAQQGARPGPRRAAPAPFPQGPPPVPLPPMPPRPPGQ
jgi:Spy/CpxP family protein refolding chaperone